MSATNIVFNMDLSAVIEAHERSGSGVTMIYKKADRQLEEQVAVDDEAVEEQVIAVGAAALKVGDEAVLVANSIIMQGCVIKRGARVENAIVDKNNVVEAGTVLTGTPDNVLVVPKVAIEN